MIRRYNLHIKQWLKRNCFFFFKKPRVHNTAQHRWDGLQITCYSTGTVVLNDGGSIKINCDVLGISHGRKNNNPPNDRGRSSECLLRRLRLSLSRNVSGLLHALYRWNDENFCFFIIGPGDQWSGNGNGNDGDKWVFDVSHATVSKRKIGLLHYLCLYPTQVISTTRILNLTFFFPFWTDDVLGNVFRIAAKAPPLFIYHKNFTNNN